MMMRILLIITVLITVMGACASKPQGEPKTPTDPNQFSDSNSTPFSEGLLTEYDIWVFLNEKPSEKDVLSMFGAPDSVWIEEDQNYKIFYYYIPEIRDYNSIEMDVKTQRVSGFEWD